MNRYTTRQEELNRSYLDTYKNWIGGLSDEDRGALESSHPGLLKPQVDGKAGGVSNCDLADSPLASYDPRIEEPSVDKTLNKAAQNELIWEILRRMLGELKSQRKPGLSLECLCLVSGLAYQGDSQQEIAIRHGVTRAAVSKRSVELCKALGLEPSRAMRSLEAREAYSVARNKSLGK